MVYNPDLVSLRDTMDTPCLVLLGEPGIGKSSTLQNEKGQLEHAIGLSGGRILWFDLRGYGSEDRLVRNLFENTIVRDWAEGTGRLYLFLDSLDECLLRIDTLAALLVDELGRLPVDRLYLRVACRTADWPLWLEEGLKRLWGPENVSVFELAPLRRVDVAEAARVSGVDPQSFLDEISQLGVVPLAIKPVTLKFLVNLFRRNGQLPSTQPELYLEGCRILCEEPPESSRRAARLLSPYSAWQRLSVAARIAAVTVFGNRFAVWTGVDLADVPAEDVALNELCGGTERTDDEEIAVTEGVLRDVLATGLFTSRGLNRMGWAHQTYAEFLAAWYLAKRRMPVNLILNVIVHPDDPSGRVVPQLREVAAWLATMLPAVFDRILDIEPELLLRSDVATMTPERRAALVTQLLNRTEENWHPEIGLSLPYAKLAHPGLPDQLQPVLADATQPSAMRCYRW